MADTIDINIRLADVAPLSLPGVKRSDEEQLRKVEKTINSVWNNYRARYQRYGSQQLLAMVTFRFAQLYLKSVDEQKELDRTLDEFEKSLDDILLHVRAD